MAWKRKLTGGFVAFVGFMLSPLSWWNDLFVNVPLALCFAWVVSLFYRPAFEESLVIGYWLTNLLGFLLMHLGARAMRSKESSPLPPHAWWKDILISLAYTALIVVLIKAGVLKPIQSYLKQ
jgi:hypothetical protein